MFQVPTPGGSVSLVPADRGVLIKIDSEELILITHDEDTQKHVIRVWDHTDPEGDPVYKQVIDPAKIPGFFDDVELVGQIDETLRSECCDQPTRWVEGDSYCDKCGSLCSIKKEEGEA